MNCQLQKWNYILVLRTYKQLTLWSNPWRLFQVHHFYLWTSKTRIRYLFLSIKNSKNWESLVNCQWIDIFIESFYLLNIHSTSRLTQPKGCSSSFPTPPFLVLQRLRRFLVDGSEFTVPNTPKSLKRFSRLLVLFILFFSVEFVLWFISPNIFYWNLFLWVFDWSAAMPPPSSATFLETIL